MGEDRVLFVLSSTSSLACCACAHPAATAALDHKPQVVLQSLTPFFHKLRCLQAGTHTLDIRKETVTSCSLYC